MTSKSCFFRYLKEDMRHRVWMLALSVLGNMMAILVVYLLTVSRDLAGAAGADWTEPVGEIWNLHSFFARESCTYGGLVAVVMAFVVGFAGFRHLFHRNMTDTWHSMPVKRNTLFLVSWLNGLLIWLAPFAAGMGITILLGEIRLGRLRTLLETQLLEFYDGGLSAEEEAMLSGGTLFLEMLATAATVFIAFLLVYHLALLAVMLCGNALNAICVALSLGCGVISVYIMAALFASCYFDTFADVVIKELEWSLHASPLISAAWLLIVRASDWEGQVRLSLSLLPELGVALALWAGALFLHNRRPSELAGQGLKNRPVGCLIRTVSGVTAGMGGWLLFTAIVVLNAAELESSWNEDALAWSVLGWSVFGCVLAAVLVFGVLDIIFQMDFKAFLAHRRAMALTAAAALGLCLAFQFDWFGYDTWLPREGKVAEISLCSREYSNGNIGYYDDLWDEEHILNRMHLTDRQAAWDFLQAAVRVQSGQVTGQRADRFRVRVTLESGRAYYREYVIRDTECEAAYALLVSPEYQREAYMMTERRIEELQSFILWRGGEETLGDQAADPKFAARIADHLGGWYQDAIRELCEAYNRDIQENPGVTVSGDGILLCTVRLKGESYSTHYDLEVYDTMENTVEVLKSYGFDDFVEKFAAEDTASIRLGLYLQEELQGPELVEAAGSVYGTGIDDGRMISRTDRGKEAAIVVTDPEELAELLELICYDERHGYGSTGIFYPGMAGHATLTDKDGRTWKVYVPKGMLAEKYILRFGEISD